MKLVCLNPAVLKLGVATLLRVAKTLKFSKSPKKQHFTWYLYILRDARFREGREIFQTLYRVAKEKV